MPNIVTTVCTVTGTPASVERFRATCIRPDVEDVADGEELKRHMLNNTRPPISTTKVFFDFNAVIPKPACVDKTASGPARGPAELACFEETGFYDWYDWSRHHWGVKWNAMSYRERSAEPGKFVFEFETAWGFPEPVFQELTQQYPELVFEVVSIIEYDAQFVGVYAGSVSAFEAVPKDAERKCFVYGPKP